MTKTTDLGSLASERQVGCPICTSAVRFLFTVSGVPIFRCRSCQHSYAEYNSLDRHVSTVFGDNYFFAGGAGYLNYLNEGELLRRQGRRYGAILRRYVPVASRILDVGSAAGFIAAGMQEYGLSVTALEPNQRMASYASDMLGGRVLCADIETLTDDIGYDVVTMIQLVAHLVNPRRAFRAMAQATNPGGYWLIEGWNSNSITARIRRKAWHVYNPPSVLQYFSRRSLDLLAAEFGLVRVSAGRPVKLITAAHAASLLGFLQTQSLLMRMAYGLVKRIPPKLTLPYPGDDIFWALYQKRPVRAS